MPEQDWKAIFEKEMQAADAARRMGNEGRARVCARRAAGILCSQFLLQNGIEAGGLSALDFLQQVQGLETLDEQTRAVLGFFLKRVDEKRNLPEKIDLLAQARWLRQHLVKE